MAKTSRQPKPIREYDDGPLIPDFSKTGDDFVNELMNQVPPAPEQMKNKDQS